MAKVAVSGGIGNVFSQISVFILTGILSLYWRSQYREYLAAMALSSTIFNVLGNISQRLVQLKVQTRCFNKYEQLEPAAL